MMCPCWRSVKEGARVPVRIAGLQKRIISILIGLDNAGNSAERKAFEARASFLNAALRGDAEWAASTN